MQGRPKGNPKDDKPKSRYELFGEGDYRLTMPEVEGGEYIINHWQKSGMYSSGMNGLMPLSWLELQAYSVQSGASLDGWESEQVMLMSKAYVAFSRDSDELNCMAPYTVELTEEQELAIKAQTVANARNILRKKPT